MGKCKHNLGWCLIDECHIFIFEDSKVTFAFQGHKRDSYKLKFVCNNPDCKKIRNIYIKAEVVKYGKIEAPQRSKKNAN